MKSTLPRFILLLSIQLWSSNLEASRLYVTSCDTVSLWSETGTRLNENPVPNSSSIVEPIEPVFNDCPAPIPYTLENYSVNSVYLQWGYSADANTTFTIEIKPSTATSWSTITVSNATSYNVKDLVPNTYYSWRVRSDCSPFSTTATTSTGGCGIYNQRHQPMSTSAILEWRSALNTTYNLRWREQGGEWTEVSSLTGTTRSASSIPRFYLTASYSLTGLVPNAVYEWQVEAVCGQGYTSTYAPISFTANCNSPTSVSVNSIRQSGAVLNWNSLYSNGFLIQYRPKSTTDVAWLTTTSVFYNFYTSIPYWTTGLSNLTASTEYEVRIQAQCPDRSASEFTDVYNFTTVSCTTVASNLRSSAIGPVSANLAWEGTYENSYILQSRIAGTISWSQVAASYTGGTLTNLIPSTAYEWRILTECTPQSITTATDTQHFSTVSCSANRLTYLSTFYVDANSTRLSWSEQYPASGNYIIRYRIIDTADWMVKPSTISSFYTLTGLTSHTNYEWQIALQCMPDYASGFSSSQYFSQTPYCNTAISTTQNGDWTNPAVWSCNRVPLITDPVQVMHTIMIPDNGTGRAQRVSYGSGGLLRFGTGGRLLLGQ